MKKKTLNKTLKSGLALALMGVIATSSVACSLLPSSEEEGAVTAQVESTVMAEEPTVIETIKIAEPADMLQVAPVEPEETYSPEPVTLSFFNESITTINEDGEEQTTIQKVISANVTPEGASVAFDWHVEWATNNEGAGAAVTDYLTVERVSGTFNKATIIAHQIFPNSTIKVVATAKGSGVYGECIVSFVGLPTEINFTVTHPIFEKPLVDDSSVPHGSDPINFYDEDWQTEVMYIDDTAYFSYEFDNPFHYIQEGYEPTFTYSAKLVGAYGFTLTKTFNGEKDPNFTPLYGEFTLADNEYVEEYDNMSMYHGFGLNRLYRYRNGTYERFDYEFNVTELTLSNFYIEINRLLGNNHGFKIDGADITSDTFNVSLLDFSHISNVYGYRYSSGAIYDPYDFIAFKGLNSIDYACTLSNGSESYILEPCYRDNKLPYIELTISTGNATKTLNVRFGDEITGVDVNNGSVVL